MSISILRVKDAEGNIIEIPAIKGDKGDAYILTEADKEEISNMAKPDIDQTYSPESENAQSGKAVAEAVSSKADKEEWELIDNITLEEDVLYSVTKNMYTNEPLNLKKFKVLVVLPQVSERVSVWLKLNNCLAMFTEQSTATAINPSFSIEGDYTYDWQFITALNNSGAGGLGIRYSTPGGHRYATALPYPCTKIELALNAGMSTTLPIGTIIKLWGVRA